MSRRFHNESAFNRWVQGELEKAGAHCLAIVGSEMQESGWPDRYVAHVGYHGWIEGKVDNRQLTTAQRLTMKALACRCVAAVELKWITHDETVLCKDPWGLLLGRTSYEALTGTPGVKPGAKLLLFLGDCVCAQAKAGHWGREALTAVTNSAECTE